MILILSIGTMDKGVGKIQWHTRSVSSIPGEDSGELSEGKLTEDNWCPLNMARGTRFQEFLFHTNDHLVSSNTFYLIIMYGIKYSNLTEIILNIPIWPLDGTLTLYIITG